MRTVLMIILGVISLLVIVAVMFQSSNGGGLSSTIAGAGASGAFKKKSKGYDALLNKLTIVLGVVFVALTIVLLVIK
ncbi:MAG: preprotein translocase subunit SecG [Firmicutes bacterium]|nr:preprotein translocase subunit SecG [Bacillota bacterium]